MGAIPVADTAYLKRRRGKGRSGYRWYARVPVPKELQPILRKKTIERALNTSDLKEAIRRKHAVLAEIFADFERAKLGKLSSADIEYEAQLYLRERLEAIQAQPDNAFEDNGHELAIEVALDVHRKGFADDEWYYDDAWSDHKKMAVAIARKYGTTPSDEQQREIGRALLRAEIKAMERALAIHNGQIPEPITVLNARAVDPITATPLPRTRIALKQGKGLRVSEAATAYIAERNRQRRSPWTGQTLNQAQTTFRLFADFTRDAPIDAIGRKEVASFLTTIAGLDPNYGRRKKLNLDALLKKFPARDGHGLSGKTLNRHSGVLFGLFDWAIRSGKIEGENPAKGHHRSEVANGYDSPGGRRSFSADELTKLFDGRLFAVSRARRVQPSEHSTETALAWLIPIALFSGMRLDEICGLRALDVCVEGSILYFNLTSHEGRRLKTAASRRTVPVHSELIRIGFGDYLTHVRGQEHEHLFPTLKGSGPDKKRSWYVGKRFTEYRRAVGVRDPRTVFHCFRKNVATALQRGRVPLPEAERLLGHKTTSMSYGLYSDGLDLPGLARAVEAISYPGLDLSHLRASGRKRPVALPKPAPRSTSGNRGHRSNGQGLRHRT